MAPKYIVNSHPLLPQWTLLTNKVTFHDSAATEEINSYMHQIQVEGGFVTNRFPDMIARGFSYVPFPPRLRLNGGFLLIYALEHI